MEAEQYFLNFLFLWSSVNIIVKCVFVLASDLT